MGVELDRRRFLGGLFGVAGGLIVPNIAGAKNPVPVPERWGLKEFFSPDSPDVKPFSLLYFGTADVGLCGTDLDDLNSVYHELQLPVNMVYIFPDDISARSIVQGARYERSNLYKLEKFDRSPFWAFSGSFEVVDSLYREQLRAGFYKRDLLSPEDTIGQHSRVGVLIDPAGKKLARYKLGTGPKNAREKLSQISTDIKDYCNPRFGSKLEHCL